MKTFTPRLRTLIVLLLAFPFANSCEGNSDDYSLEKIIAMERAALDRWGKGDPQGYLEIMAPEATYFDPTREKRVDGLETLKQYIIPFTGKIHIDRYEMINPQVQRDGDVAVLTFNLVDTGKPPDRQDTVTLKWNSTEVYRRIGGSWKIIHSHWSYTTPELKQITEEKKPG